MNKNARAGMKKAAGLTAAGKKKLQNRTYPKPAQLSSQNLKDVLGKLIFFLHGPITQSQREAGWQFFKVLLEQYLMG